MTRVNGAGASVPSGGTGTATATCPAGYAPISGGGYLGGWNARLGQSWPSVQGPGGTWAVTWYGDAGSDTLTAYALCAL